MRAISLPPVRYDATAVRPDWDDLPRTLREAITDRLGAPVAAAATSGAGFTRGFAAVLHTHTGESVFVKAAPARDPLGHWYAREAAVTAALPPAVPAARPRWTLATGEHFVLCLDAVAGRVPHLPWAPTELAAVLRAWAVAAEALGRPDDRLLAVGLPRLPDILRSELSCWSEVAAGRVAIPAGLAGQRLAAEVGGPTGATPAARVRVPNRLAELADLERALPAYTHGPGVMHGDLRLDNVLIGTAGDAWLCDWTWPCVGAPWFDTVTLLITAYASGLDADALLAAHPTAAGLPAEAVDGALAALSGYWLTRAAGPPSTASPHSRAHQRFSGGQALAWLAARRGW